MNYIAQAVGFITSLFLMMFFAMMSYMALVMLPMQLYADEVCLRRQIPHAEVTVTLDLYCVDGKGTVTPL